MEYEDAGGGQGGRYQEGRHQEGRRKKRRKRKKHGFFYHIFMFLITIIVVGGLTGGMFLGIFMTYVRTTLSTSLNINLDNYSLDLSSFVYYQDEETGEWVQLQTLHGDENRVWVDYDEMSPYLAQAAVAIEDERFYSHHGVDWPRTLKATANMLVAQNSSFGGSTITQQMLKNLTGEDQNTVKRKITEIFRALEFEKNYSKEDILELYLNKIYFGKGCYGVQTAAQYYFGKNASELDLAESACIIAITNNPSMYGPFSTITVKTSSGDKTPLELNKQRQELILDKMEDDETGLNFITPAEKEQAKAETLQFVQRTSTADQALAEEAAANGAEAQSYFLDQVRRDVTNDLAEALNITATMAEDQLLRGGYKIYTTLVPSIQSMVEDVYEDRSNLDNLKSQSGQLINSAITIVDVSSGAVVAMVGGMGEKTQDMSRNAAVDPYQCGSSIKPLSDYAPALDAGAITPATAFDNYPVQMLNGSPWPKNSPAGYTGLTTLETGIMKSINTVAVRAFQSIGAEESYRFMTENLGFTTLTDDDKSAGALGLGGLTQGVTTEEMAAAYATFANNGVYNEPHLYLKVEDSQGNVVLEKSGNSHVAMKETTAYFMNNFLHTAVTQGTGTSANFDGQMIAGKTGTTNDNFARYFVGYTPYYCAAVWTGYKSNEKIVYSGNPAITMWRKVMTQLHEGLEYKEFSKPSSGLTTVTVCTDSGLKPNSYCSLDSRGRVRTVEVAVGTEPTDVCDLHVGRLYCTAGQCAAGSSCPSGSLTTISLLNYSRENFGVSVDDSGHMLYSLNTGPCPVHSGYYAPTEEEETLEGENPEEETEEGGNPEGETPEGEETGGSPLDQPLDFENSTGEGTGTENIGEQGGTETNTGAVEPEPGVTTTEPAPDPGTTEPEPAAGTTESGAVTPDPGTGESTPSGTSEGGGDTGVNWWDDPFV